MAYSKDFIKRAVEYKQNSHTFKELRETFGVSSATYYDWERKLENEFEFGAKAKKERNRKIDKEILKQSVAEKPDAFLSEYAKQFNCSQSAVHYALEKLKITRKKRLLPIMKSQKKSGLNI
jgi:transposase